MDHLASSDQLNLLSTFLDLALRHQPFILFSMGKLREIEYEYIHQLPHHLSNFFPEFSTTRSWCCHSFQRLVYLRGDGGRLLSLTSDYSFRVIYFSFLDSPYRQLQR